MKTQTWMLLGTIVVVILVAAVILVPMAFAQGPDTLYGVGVQQGMGPGQQAFLQGGPGFVDEDGDGVCDNCGNAGRGPGPGFVDEDGDGVCDNFVDEDGDGVCDNAGTGQGPGFVDEDGDGVCDHAETGQQGARRGRGMGRWAQ